MTERLSPPLGSQEATIQEIEQLLEDIRDAFATDECHGPSRSEVQSLLERAEDLLRTCLTLLRSRDEGWRPTNGLILAMAKTCGNRPRVHGNGFIQLDLTPLVRLHVWGDERIPRQKSDTPIHDHTFGFTSYVLVGAIEQRVYCVSTSGLYERNFTPHQAIVRHGEDTVLSPIGERLALALDAKKSRIVRAGESYSMRPGEIHESRPIGLAVSVIVKDGPTLAQGGPSPTVFVRQGVEPDNEFDRYAADPRLLWQIIESALSAPPLSAGAPAR